MGRDWKQWHDAYADPNSSLSRRLATVQRLIAGALDAAPPGALRLVSMCAGEGRDVLGVLPDHPRRDDVRVRLVELDPDLAERARAAAASAGLPQVEVVTGDAGSVDAYAGMVPADVVLVCGVFGNITDADIANTVAILPQLCNPSATVIWTRHRQVPDVTPAIRRWFAESGFDEVAFESEGAGGFGVGAARYASEPRAFTPGAHLFRFVV